MLQSLETESSNFAGWSLRMLSQSSCDRENPRIEYLAMVELACGDLQQKAQSTH